MLTGRGKILAGWSNPTASQNRSPAPVFVVMSGGCLLGKQRWQNCWRFCG
ncbi:tail assembly protein [Escherichia coli]|nr:tail assembly protein [Escherichia coli]ELH3675749.1 tail assembly protein [Escherichia coli]